MTKDDKAKPALEVCLQISIYAMETQAAATRALAKAAKGQIPGLPADGHDVAADFRRKMKQAMTGSGLERDVMGVFLEASVDMALASIGNSSSLHEAAHALAQLRRYSVVEVPQAEPPIAAHVNTRAHSAEVVPPRPCPMRKPLPVWLALPAAAAFSMACGLLLAQMLAPSVPAFCSSLVHDPATAAFWRQVFEENDAERLQQKCLKQHRSQGGRAVCVLAIWSGPTPTEIAP